MADAIYSARGNTRDEVGKRLAKLTLAKNERGQYTHDDVMMYIAALKKVLKGTFNVGDPGNGMLKLCNGSRGQAGHLAAIKSTDVATRKSVLAASKSEAEAASLAEGSAVAPTITSQNDAQDEADRINLMQQAVIGAKEGAVEAIIEQIGQDVADTIINDVDGEEKGIDEYELARTMTAPARAVATYGGIPSHSCQMMVAPIRAGAGKVI